MSIIITKNAWKKLSNILKASSNNLGFLYSATTGGCNGFNFDLSLLDEKKYNSLENGKFITKLSEKDCNVYVDPLTELHLHGSTIDYVNEDINKGLFESKFVFLVNKKDTATCGCGTSFYKK